MLGLEIAGCILLYSFVGYAIGKISNREYFDDTSTENLGWFRKLKRLYLFPVSYHYWRERNDISDGATGLLPTIRAFAGCFTFTNYCDNVSRKENYCRAMVFLWPLRAAINIVMSAAQILFFTAFGLCRTISLLPVVSFRAVGAGTRKLKYLRVGAHKLLSENHINVDARINELDYFRTTMISKEIAGLVAQKKVLCSRQTEVQKGLDEWGQGNGSLTEMVDSQRVEEITAGLQEERRQTADKLEKIGNAVSEMESKERRLKEITGHLKKCRTVKELGISIPSAAGEGLIKQDGVAAIAFQLLSTAQDIVDDFKKRRKETASYLR